MTAADKDPAREPEIATGTLAEIYAQQGLHERALEIYRRIADRRPGDAEIARRIAALEEAIARRDEEERAERDAPPEPAVSSGGPAAPEPAVPNRPESPGPGGAEPDGPEPREAPGADREAAGPGTPPSLDRDDPFHAWLEGK